MSPSEETPGALRIWFIIHFVLDIAFAIPLLLFPEWLLGLFGWEQVDPLLVRLVGAALFAIGVESWLGRDQSVDSYRTMLRLKLLWSSSATIGILLAMLEGAPAAGWLFFAIFFGFFFVWAYWYRRLTSRQVQH